MTQIFVVVCLRVFQASKKDGKSETPKKVKKKKKRKERKEKIPQSKGCFWTTHWELRGRFFVFFFSQKCKFRVEGEDHCRTRCRASLGHGFDSLQGGVSIAQIDVRLE